MGKHSWDKQIFAERLKEMRIGRGLSAKELADEMGVSPQSISNYETTRQMPSVEMLCRTAMYFGASVDYMLGLSGEYEPKNVTTEKISESPKGFESQKVCGTCKWYRLQNDLSSGLVCANRDSQYDGEWTGCEHGCSEWRGGKW